MINNTGPNRFPLEIGRQINAQDLNSFSQMAGSESVKIVQSD